MPDLNNDADVKFRAPAPSRRKQWLQVVVYLVLLLLVAWLYSHPPDGGNPPEESNPNRPTVSATERPRDERQPTADNSKRPAGKAAERDEDRGKSLIARNVRVTNKDGRVIYRGDVDVGPTLERIDRGQRLRFSHDGIVFENREKRLPLKPSGYYREFIHPTKGESGPGGQRVVLGQNGEAYYSPDHYHTFRRIR